MLWTENLWLATMIWQVFYCDRGKLDYTGEIIFVISDKWGCYRHCDREHHWGRFNCKWSRWGCCRGCTGSS
jgi:hypothetical protein